MDDHRTTYAGSHFQTLVEESIVIPIGTEGFPGHVEPLPLTKLPHSQLLLEHWIVNHSNAKKVTLIIVPTVDIHLGNISVRRDPDDDSKVQLIWEKGVHSQLERVVRGLGSGSHRIIFAGKQKSMWKPIKWPKDSAIVEGFCNHERLLKGRGGQQYKAWNVSVFQMEKSVKARAVPFTVGESEIPPICLLKPREDLREKIPSKASMDLLLITLQYEDNDFDELNYGVGGSFDIDAPPVAHDDEYGDDGSDYGIDDTYRHRPDWRGGGGHLHGDRDTFTPNRMSPVDMAHFPPHPSSYRSVDRARSPTPHRSKVAMRTSGVHSLTPQRSEKKSARRASGVHSLSPHRSQRSSDARRGSERQSRASRHSQRSSNARRASERHSQAHSRRESLDGSRRRRDPQGRGGWDCYDVQSEDEDEENDNTYEQSSVRSSDHSAHYSNNVDSTNFYGNDYSNRRSRIPSEIGAAMADLSVEDSFESGRGVEDHMNGRNNGTASTADSSYDSSSSSTSSSHVRVSDASSSVIREAV